MQNLHRNFAARLMNAICNDLMIGNIGFVKQPRRAWKNAAFAVRRDAPCHHQCNAAARAFSVKFSDAVPIFVSSKLVCIDPIRTRFFNVVKPRSNGARRLGYDWDIWVLRTIKYPRSMSIHVYFVTRNAAAPSPRCGYVGETPVSEFPTLPATGQLRLADHIPLRGLPICKNCPLEPNCPRTKIKKV